MKQASPFFTWKLAGYFLGGGGICTRDLHDFGFKTVIFQAGPEPELCSPPYKMALYIGNLRGLFHPYLITIVATPSLKREFLKTTKKNVAMFIPFSMKELSLPFLQKVRHLDLVTFDHLAFPGTSIGAPPEGAPSWAQELNRFPGRKRWETWRNVVLVVLLRAVIVVFWLVVRFFVVVVVFVYIFVKQLSCLLTLVPRKIATRDIYIYIHNRWIKIREFMY